jgi:hypothetical protein
MQFIGFLLGHIEVEIQGRAYDLHNFYLADSIRYDVVSQEFVLRFTRRSDAWVPSEEADHITISFHGVEYFEVSGQAFDSADDDAGIIHSVGSVEPDADTETFFLTDNFQPEHHVVMRFESGLTVRLQAAEAHCAVVFQSQRQ